MASIKLRSPLLASGSKEVKSGPIAVQQRPAGGLPKVVRSSAFHYHSHSGFRTPGRSSNDRSHVVMVSGDVDQATSAGVTRVPSQEILNLWRTAEAVCFDVDSTVCLDEGIDELAAFCGAGEAVAAWTAKAMGGSVPFEVALAARLEIFKPSATDVANFLASNPPKLSPGIADLVDRIRSRGADVYLISGGFRQMIEPVAAILDIPKENIFANRILFNDDGSYAGFDANEPTSRSGGKAAAIESLKEVHGYKTLVMIGDGATDLEARRPGGADAFIGYGGVQFREKVAVAADWFVYEFTPLVESMQIKSI